MYSPDVSSVRAHQDQRHAMRLARVAPRSDPLCRPVPSVVKKMAAMEFAITARRRPG